MDSADRFQRGTGSRRHLFPFALEGLTEEDKLYGIPVFLCGNFLIYDGDCAALDAAEHLTDLADMSEILVVNSKNPVNRQQYSIEVIADTWGIANPSVDGDTADAMGSLTVWPSMPTNMMTIPRSRRPMIWESVRAISASAKACGC